MSAKLMPKNIAHQEYLDAEAKKKSRGKELEKIIFEDFYGWLNEKIKEHFKDGSVKINVKDYFLYISAMKGKDMEKYVQEYSQNYYYGYLPDDIEKEIKKEKYGIQSNDRDGLLTPFNHYYVLYFS